MICTSLHAEPFYGSRLYNIYESYYTLFRDGYAHDLTREQASKLFMGNVNPDWTVYNRAHEAVIYERFGETHVRSLLSDMYGELIDARLNQLLSDSLGDWVQQGEFEKSSEYQRRLSQDFQAVFDDYCKRLFQPSSFRLIPLHYDPDEEIYTLSLEYTMPETFNLINYYTGYRYGERQHGSDPDVHISAKVGSDIIAFHMSIEDAKYLKEHRDQIEIYDVVFGMREYSVVPYTYTVAVNRHTGYDSKAPNVRDFEVHAANLDFNIPFLNGIKFNFTEYRTRLVEKKKRILSEISQYKETIDAEVAKFKNTQYYLHLTPDQQKEILRPYQRELPTVFDDASVFESYDLVLVGDSIYSKLIDEVRRINPQSYALGYLSDHPELRDSISRAYPDFKCNYEYATFMLAYVNGTLDFSKGKCREEAWAIYGHYYSTRAAFDMDYANGVDMEARFSAWERYKSYYDSYDDFCLDYVLDVDMNALVGDINYISRELDGKHKMLIANEWAEIPVTSLKLNNAENPYTPQPAKNIVHRYIKLNGHPSFQEKAAEVIISKSYYTKKEYDKSGKYFSTKREFVSAYFSTDYKNLLKEAKKSSKSKK